MLRTSSTVSKVICNVDPEISTPVTHLTAGTGSDDCRGCLLAPFSILRGVSSPPHLPETHLSATRSNSLVPLTLSALHQHKAHAVRGSLLATGSAWNDPMLCHHNPQDSTHAYANEAVMDSSAYDHIAGACCRGCEQVSR